jgi:hypothetical protein
MAARVIGIGDSTPKKKKALTEAGYAQGSAGGNIPAGSQGIEPDVSSNQGEVLDKTNVESDQLQRGIMTRELFAKTGHDGHG